MQPKIYRNKFNCLGQAIAIIHLYTAEVASEIWHFQHHRVELGTTVTTRQAAISTDKAGLWIFPGLLPALTGQSRCFDKSLAHCSKAPRVQYL